MNGKEKYDIFISYRRETGRDDARLLQLALAARGYSVFFDYDSLKDGKFNESIYSAIDACDVFILMMTQGSLDRCAEEGDWVRREIALALELGKRIVPVAPNDQTWNWPTNLPAELLGITEVQVSQLDKEALFDRSIDEIEVNRFSAELRSRRRVPGVVSDDDNYLSSVSRASEVFVGRDQELAKLSRMLSNHKVPVITGAGGVGKSELVRQYAVRCRDAYPGGRFQVDMETARNWNDAFDILLKGSVGNGQKIRDLLYNRTRNGRDANPLDDCERNECDDKSLNDYEGNELNAKLLDVPQAILRRARRSGPILLFLDNVESLTPFVDKDCRINFFHTNFADGVYVDIVITARVCDVIIRPTGGLMSLPLGDLTPDAAQELVLKDFPAICVAERESAGRVAEWLGYRALYLRRVPALIADDYAPIICSSFVDLERELKKNLFATVAAETEETHLPDVLWKMTCDRLSRIKPLGPACIKLAQIASFFSPNGFESPILEYLWKSVVALDIDERFYDRVMKIGVRFNIFQNVDLVDFGRIHIHRLDREAIRATAMTQRGLIDDVGKALKANDYGGDMWANVFLANQPLFADYCPWEKLSLNDWYWLLLVQPQFVTLCPNLGWGWSFVLCQWPQLSSGCPWESFSGADWCNLLKCQPKFADRCPWEKLDSSSITSILKVDPQYVDRVSLDKLEGGNWEVLLCARPQLADRCPWDILTGDNWSCILAAQPQFADCCPWDILTGDNWSCILAAQPQFADRVPLDKLEGGDWETILGAQPQLSHMCPSGKLKMHNWTRLLMEQPQLANQCPCASLDADTWANLVLYRPQLADFCPWEEFNGKDWVDFLCRNHMSTFASRCKWERLSDEDWARLLKRRPQYVSQCPNEKIVEVGTILFQKYEVVGMENSWLDSFGSLQIRVKEVCELFRVQPLFISCCPREKLENLNGCDWVMLIDAWPQFAERCQWERMTGEDWMRLLEAHPQFSYHCQWEKLNAKSWERLLRHQPQFRIHCQLELTKETPS